VVCFEFADPGPGGVKLVLQPHGPGGGVERHALVEQLPHAGGELQLAPGVAAVPATGALRGEDSRGVEAAQERRLHPQQIRGLPMVTAG
jgi:hypothetical protein